MRRLGAHVASDDPALKFRILKSKGQQRGCCNCAVHKDVSAVFGGGFGGTCNGGKLKATEASQNIHGLVCSPSKFFFVSFQGILNDMNFVFFLITVDAGAWPGECFGGRAECLADYRGGWRCVSNSHVAQEKDVRVALLKRLFDNFSTYLHGHFEGVFAKRTLFCDVTSAKWIGLNQWALDGKVFVEKGRSSGMIVMGWFFVRVCHTNIDNIEMSAPVSTEYRHGCAAHHKVNYHLSCDFGRKSANPVKLCDSVVAREDRSSETKAIGMLAVSFLREDAENRIKNAIECAGWHGETTIALICV